MKNIVLGILVVAVLAMVPIVSFAEETELPTLGELVTAVTGLIDRIEVIEVRVKGLEALETRVEKLETVLSPTPTPTIAALPETPTATPCYTFLRVSAQKVIDDYGEDKEVADKKYMNVLFEVSGQIARIDDDDGELYVIFNIRGGPDNLRCNFALGQENEWKSLSKDDRVVVLGAGRGKGLGPFGDFNLDACILVEKQ